MKILLAIIIGWVSGQAGCESEPNPGPNGYQIIGSQFEYLSEVVETQVSMDGSFLEYQFVIKFQSKGTEYGLTLNPNFEIETGVKDVVLLELSVSNDLQIWKIVDDRITNVGSDYTLGKLESGKLGGFPFATTEKRPFAWVYDGYCVRSLDDGSLVSLETDYVQPLLGKTIKTTSLSNAVTNSTIDRVSTPPAKPDFVKRSYIQTVSIEYQIATYSKKFSENSEENSIYYYDEMQASEWSQDTCTTKQILDSDLMFGVENLKIGSMSKPYPRPPKHFFRYGRDYNSSYERTEPFDEFQTCYFDTYNFFEENNFQQVVPYEHGWLTPSGGVLVELSPTRQYKDQFGRTMVTVETYEHFIDYGTLPNRLIFNVF